MKQSQLHKDLINGDFSGLKLMLASPEIIIDWSYGEVLKPETINYRTFKPEKDGLFDERIFGPTKDFECYCGKYKRIRYKGIVCDRCGVEVTSSSVRRERMGHIKLATPVAHIWYFKGASSPLSILLSMTASNLERIIYYALYLVKDVNEEGRETAVAEVEKAHQEDLDVLAGWLKNEKEKIQAEEKEALEKAQKKMKNNKEQLDLKLNEVKFKYREKYTALGQQHAEKKTEKDVFYDRLGKVVKTVQPYGVMEEEDYLFLQQIGAHEFVSVGMGSEVLLEVLSNIDLKDEYGRVVTKLSKIKGDKRKKLLKKARLIEALMKSNVDPKWMIQVVLPVIPPDLRPVVQLSGGKFATSDLNDFYRRVINRNNRLKHLIELGAPEIILRNEKRMLQESVDSLIDLSKSRGSQRSYRARAQKSLSDILKGKQGRFRQNLLGKRVDYSGRSVIIGGPDLELNQCGLPKEMAIELFKPFLLREIIIRGLAQNIKSAKNFLETKDPVIYDILEEITKNHPVLLNRAPTLHKLSILGFYPVLTDDYAIKLHPIVCGGFNADFDGDQMGVYVPLSKGAIEEIENRMMPYRNFLKPADGSPIMVPNKEMAYGCYYITSVDARYDDLKDEELKYFKDEDEALLTYTKTGLKLREPILVRRNNEKIRTTVGRIIFNQQLPQELQYINDEVRAGDIKELIVKAIEIFEGEDETVAQLIDKIKNIGFWAATRSGGASFSVFDNTLISEKDELIAESEKKVQDIEGNYFKGLITEEEKKRLSNNIWIDTTEKIADLTWNAIEEENPVKIIMKSGGARATKEQLKQLSAMKGLVVDPLGKIIEVPTKSNYREGLSVLEYITNARGARKGLIDSALKTADAGYLTRRLVDVSHDMIIREDDCGCTEGIRIRRDSDRGDKFADRVRGKYLAEAARGSDKKAVLSKGTLIGEDEISALEKAEVDSVLVRSPLYCSTEYGLCVKCYGINWATRKLVTIGTPVGVLAAQSIGEPGTQLTMRVKHFGGIVVADVTQGLPRVEELFEIRTPKVLSPISDIAGKVSVQEDTEKDVYIVKISSTDKSKEIREFLIPTSRKLTVEDGQMIPAGQKLCEGYLDIKEVLSIRGLKDAQAYLINEIQKVYESQGIAIHDKHFEVIVRKMSDKIIVDNEGDTKFITGEVVSKYQFNRENKRVLAQGGRPAVGRVSILGITRAAIYADSWLSAASFQGTTRVLTQASLKGQVDNLVGLKENVIIGRLIPVTEELLDKYFGDGEAESSDSDEILEDDDEITEDKQILGDEVFEDPKDDDEDEESDELEDEEIEEDKEPSDEELEKEDAGDKE